MVERYFGELQRVLTVDRLKRYRPRGGDRFATMVTYQWNIELCESLYQSIGALEVVMRNSLHHVLTMRHGQPDWYDLPGFLKWRQPEQVAAVKREITASRKPITPGRVIAGLSFGFWTTLLSRGYGSFWSSDNRVRIRQAFPFAPVGRQYRGRVWDQINTVRLLRNRVFHYEAIFDDPTLVQKQSNIIEMIGWISEPMQASVRYFDRFGDMHQHGYEIIESRLRQFLADSSIPFHRPHVTGKGGG